MSSVSQEGREGTIIAPSSCFEVALPDPPRGQRRMRLKETGPVASFLLLRGQGDKM